MRVRTDAARWWRASLLVVCLFCSGCAALAFAVANAPARFTAARRVAAVPYGISPRQKLDVYVPAAAAGGGRGRPVIVFFFGGSWTDGDRASYRFAGAALAGLGYVTVVPDYRLYPEVKFPGFMDDGAQAVAWVQAHAADYGADPARIVLMGHSAGAHLAALLAVEPAYLRRAGVSMADIAALIAMSGPYDLVPDTPELQEIFTAPFGPRDWQVIARVAGPAPPTLLMHGEDDRRVHPGASTAFAAQLREAGTEVELRSYAHCDHACPLAALSVPGRSKAPSLRDIGDFLARLEVSRAERERPAGGVQ